MRRNLKYAAMVVAAGAVAVMVYGVSPASGASAHPMTAWGRGAPQSAPVQSSDSSSSGATTITFTSHTTADFFVDEAPTGTFSPGDHDIFTEDLFNGANKKIGDDHVTCTAQVDNTVLCAGEAHLSNRGTIEFSGVGNGGGKFVLAVLGGTGEFRDVGGDVTVQTSNSSDSTITLRLISLS
jgi:hypothetical protein